MHQLRPIYLFLQDYEILCKYEFYASLLGTQCDGSKLTRVEGLLSLYQHLSALSMLHYQQAGAGGISQLTGS